MNIPMNKSTDFYLPINNFEAIFIKSIWKLSDNELQERKEIILPKGTVEIIFNFSDTIKYINPYFQIKKILPAVFVNGINFKPFELVKSGKQEFVGIQLNGTGLKLLFNCSAEEFKNNVCDGINVCSMLSSLAEKLFYAQSFTQQVDFILEWIRNKVQKFKFQYSIERVILITRLIQIEEVSVKKLTHEICLSDRQLRRFSQVWLGMNIEEFIHYNKYIRTLYQIHNSKKTLTTIGMEAGYYDQSHFIREFKTYTDLTPKQYRNANSGYPGHIFI